MTTASTTAGERDAEREGGRILAFYGVLICNGLAMGILFFWLIGAVHMWTGNGGQINMLDLAGLPLLLFWLFPVAVVLSLAAGLLYLVRLDLIALAVAAAPIGLAALYYVWLVVARYI